MIEGILLFMYDCWLCLGNVVVFKVWEIFGDKVFDIIIYWNFKIGEVFNLYMFVVMVNVVSKGSINFLNLVKEFLDKNNDLIVKVVS